jgi:hypothetical protein
MTRLPVGAILLKILGGYHVSEVAQADGQRD